MCAYPCQGECAVRGSVYQSNALTCSYHFSQLWSIVAIVGGALQAGSVNIGMFMAMRGITGASIGRHALIYPLHFKSEPSL
jgi:hypothetical protein